MVFNLFSAEPYCLHGGARRIRLDLEKITNSGSCELVAPPHTHDLGFWCHGNLLPFHRSLPIGEATDLDLDFM